MASVSIAAAGIGGLAIPYIIGVEVDAWGRALLPLTLIALMLLMALLANFEPGPLPAAGPVRAASADAPRP
jgi:fucose permease